MRKALYRLTAEKYLSIRARLVLPLALATILFAIVLLPLTHWLIHSLIMQGDNQQLADIANTIQIGLLAGTIMLALVTLWLWFSVSKILARPLTQLTETTMKMSAGDLNQNLNPSLGGFKDELTILGENINILAQKINTSQADLHSLLQQVEQEAAEAREAAVSADKSNSEFMSRVSHDLRLPMTSIKGYSDLLLAGAVGPLNENQLKFLTTIRNNVDRMSNLVSDLADISRLESGRLQLELREVPIWDVIDEVITILRPQITEKQQTISVDIQGELPKAWCDRNRLAQILTNLINNANKYTAEGGVITVHAAHINDLIQIQVEDNGLGIAPEDRSHLFNKFFRSADDKIRETPGAGLGLSIAKNLVELQGGQIWAESKYRLGSSFYFTIPIAKNGKPLQT